MGINKKHKQYGRKYTVGVPDGAIKPYPVFNIFLHIFRCVRYMKPSKMLVTPTNVLASNALNSISVCCELYLVLLCKKIFRNEIRRNIQQHNNKELYACKYIV